MPREKCCDETASVLCSDCPRLPLNLQIDALLLAEDVLKTVLRVYGPSRLIDLTLEKIAAAIKAA